MHFLWALRAPKRNEQKKKRVWAVGETPFAIAKSRQNCRKAVPDSQKPSENRPKTSESRPKTSESRPKASGSVRKRPIFRKFAYETIRHSDYFVTKMLCNFLYVFGRRAGRPAGQPAGRPFLITTLSNNYSEAPLILTLKLTHRIKSRT